MDPVTIAMLAGTALNMAGKYQASKSEIAALKNKDFALESQKEELLRRVEINNEELRKEMHTFMGQQQVAAAASGIGGGSSLLAMENTAEVIATRSAMNRYEAEYEAHILGLTQEDLRRRMSEKKKATTLSMLTTGLSGTATALKYSDTREDISTDGDKDYKAYYDYLDKTSKNKKKSKG